MSTRSDASFPLNGLTTIDRSLSIQRPLPLSAIDGQFKHPTKQVIGVCRSASPELKGLGLHKVIEGVDIASPEAVARLPGQLDAGATIDNLWLNAGIGIGIEDSLEVGEFWVFDYWWGDLVGGWVWVLSFFRPFGLTGPPA